MIVDTAVASLTLDQLDVLAARRVLMTRASAGDLDPTGHAQLYESTLRVQQFMLDRPISTTRFVPTDLLRGVKRGRGRLRAVKAQPARKAIGRGKAERFDAEETERN
jgi:hypothetical protein